MDASTALLVRPGAVVNPNTVLLQLSNPELELAAQRCEWQVKDGGSDLHGSCGTAGKPETGAAVGCGARVHSDYVQAKLKADLEAKLGEQGLTSEINLKTTKAIADELSNRSSIEKKKVDISGESIEAQLAAQRVQIEKLRAACKLKKAQVDQLKVRAGRSRRACSRLPVEVGQRLTPGTCACEDRAAFEAEGGTEDRGNAGERHYARADGEDRHAERHCSGTREPHRPGGR